MKQIAIKSTSQCIITWSIFIIANLICIITNPRHSILNVICLLIYTFLLIDSILSLRKVKKFVVVQISGRKLNEYITNKKEIK